MTGLKPNLAWLRIAMGGLFLCIGLLTGCQKNCQSDKQTFSTVTAAQWRLAQTTDPQLASGLNNYNFLIMQLDATFGGSVTKVQNNKPLTPATTITWKQPSSNTMEIKYTSGGTYTYSYKLGHELEMTRMDGVYYRYVQFNGVINPDSNCTF